MIDLLHLPGEKLPGAALPSAPGAIDGEGPPVGHGTVASDALPRSDLTQLPDICCGCGAVIVVAGVPPPLAGAAIAGKLGLADPGLWPLRVPPDEAGKCDLGAIDGPAAVEWRDIPAPDGGDNEGRDCDRLSDDSAARRPTAPAALPLGVLLPIPLLLLIVNCPSI